MKTLSLLFSIFLIFQVGWSQKSGTIDYTETRQLNIEAPEGMDISELLGKSMTTNKELIFNEEASVYRDSKTNENHDKELSSDDGSFHMVIKTPNQESIHYTDLKSGEKLCRTTFMGKTFLIASEAEKMKWKLTNEKIKYLGFVCHKAELTVTDDEEEDTHIVAWFTPEIPVSVGPDDFDQLPGAILMVNVDDGEREIKATAVNLEPADADAIKKPVKGKKVSSEEYDDIVDLKMKEMEEMYGSGGIRKVIRG